MTGPRVLYALFNRWPIPMMTINPNVPQNLPFCNPPPPHDRHPKILASSRFDLVRPPKHVVDPGEVVSAAGKRVGIALRRVTLLQVGLLAEETHLVLIEVSRGAVGHPNVRTRVCQPLTSSYTSGGTVLLACSRRCRSTLSLNSAVSAVTFMLKKLLARPLP